MGQLEWAASHVAEHNALSDGAYAALLDVVHSADHLNHRIAQLFQIEAAERTRTAITGAAYSMKGYLKELGTTAVKLQGMIENLWKQSGASQSKLNEALAAMKTVRDMPNGQG